MQKPDSQRTASISKETTLINGYLWLYVEGYVAPSLFALGLKNYSAEYM